MAEILIVILGSRLKICTLPIFQVILTQLVCSTHSEMLPEVSKKSIFSEPILLPRRSGPSVVIWGRGEPLLQVLLLCQDL